MPAGTVPTVHADLLFDPFGGRWEDLREAAELAEQAGFDGIWLYDHLAGSVHGAPHVLECWTVLTAVAASVPRITVGSLVLNVANRDAGTLAVMAATLQEVGAGRLLLGIGAGGGRATPYAAEQLALGRAVPGDAARRQAVEVTVTTLRQVWSGAAGGASGFLRPAPPPPVIIGGFGPKMAELAGRLPATGSTRRPAPRWAAWSTSPARHGPRAGAYPAELVVTTSGAPGDDRLARLGVDRVITMVRPPYTPAVRRLASQLGRA